MKLDFVPARALEDGARHEFCQHCHGESVRWRTEAARRRCFCDTCGRLADRAIIIDPDTSWWVAPDGEYWHDTAGVVVQDTRWRVLFFERTAFPFGLTIPAGHVNRGEPPAAAAARELAEETGITADEPIPIGKIPIVGDQCRRGADAHMWHLYRVTVPKPVAITLNEEGISPVWLELTETYSRERTFATTRILDIYADTLARGR